MQTSTQFPALIGKDALPAIAQPKGGTMKHPLGTTKMPHPLAKGGKC